MEKWALIWTKLTPLNEENVNQLLDGIPGVYRLSYKSENDDIYVFYVGESSDIKSTLKSHIKSETNPCITGYIVNKQCYFRYAQISEEKVRKGAAKFAYNHYHPQCNVNEPEGSDTNIQVNLV